MVGIYIRVSTEEQATKGYSLQDQRRECRKKAGTIDIIEYMDDVSGEFLDRPGLSKLREDIRKGIIKRVICLDPDRLSRKLMNQLIISEELDRRGVELTFVNGDYAKTAEGQLFYSMRGAISEFEKSKINERMSRGRKSKARQGKVLRDFHVYGYMYDKATAQMVVNEEEARIVKLIFDLFTKPNDVVKGMNGIAWYLTENGVPTKQGAKVWHRQVVRQILMNQAYIGEFYQNKWNTEGMLGNKYRRPEDRVSMCLRPQEDWILIPCPPIIDEITFKHAQKLMGESKRRWAKQSRNEYLLSGLIRCGDCGNTMTGRRHKNWGKYVLEYTDVKGTAGAKHRGCGRRVKCKEVDAFVWEKILAWLNQPDEVAVSLEDSVFDGISAFGEAEIIRIEKEIEKVRTGRKRLLKLFAKQEKEMSDEEIRDAITELREEEEELSQRLELLKAHKKESDETRYTQQLVKEAAEYYFNKGEDELTFEDKKQLIRQVVREIVVLEDRVEIYLF